MPGRNDPCPCGSGKKYKKCCAQSDAANRGRAQASNLDLAISSFENGDFSAAAAAAQSYLKTNRNEPMCWQVLGVSLYYLSDFKASEDAFREVVKRDKLNPDAWNNLGLVLYEQARLDEALSACQKALKLQSDMPGAHNNLGNIYRSQGELKKAEQSYQAAIKLGMQTPEVYCNLGTVQQEQGDSAAAEHSYQKAMNIDPTFVGATGNLGALMLEKSEFAQALELLQQAYQHDPEDSDVLCNLGKYWQERGNRRKAEEFFLRAIKLYPTDVKVNYRIGLYFQSILDFNEARKYFLKAIKINPKHVESLAALGEIAFEQNVKAEAAAFFQKAMEYGGGLHIGVVKSYSEYLLYRQQIAEALSLWSNLEKHYPNNIKVKLGMAEFYKETGAFEKAERIYKKLLEKNGEDQLVLFDWAFMEESRNNVEKAASLAKQVLDIDPEHHQARVILSKALEHSKKYEEALTEVNHIDLEQHKDDSYLTYNVLFQRAKIFDKLANYDAAYADLVRANEIKSIKLDNPYSEEEDRKIFALEQEVFNSNNIEKIPRYHDSGIPDKLTPIFIVGFPRSGTTLMEQILASHSKISAGGELPFIDDAKSQIKNHSGSQSEYPENLIDTKKPITRDVISKLHDFYIRRIRDSEITKPGTTFFTDKLPHNLANLGIISRLFPDSPIIHITRHPLDACLSAFMSNFAHGHKYTSSMKNTVTHYALLMQTVEHYKSVIEMNYLQLRYEDLISDVEAKVKEVLDFIGLPWEDACLNFHKSKRVAKTASYAQVTQKIYTSSRYRYKNYYKQLEPYAEILSEAMNKFGYTFEP